jgi:hypothetical protein
MVARIAVGVAASAAMALVVAFGACGGPDESGPRKDSGAGGASGDGSHEGGGTSSGGKGGTGGVAGTAGSGGSGGWSGDSGLPSEQAWLVDAKTWKPVPGTEFTGPACPVFEAQPGTLEFPSLSWQTCGAGCELADVVQGYGSAGLLPVASTHVVGGKAGAFLVVEHLVAAARYFRVRRLVRLDDGASLGAVEAWIDPKAASSPCLFGNDRESARANILRAGTDSVQLWMLAPLDGGAWTWSLPALPWGQYPVGFMELDIDADGGAVFDVGKGAVSALLDPKVNSWTVLESPSDSRRGSGEGDLAVWTDYPPSAPERIRGWAPDGKGVRTIIDPVPAETCTVSVSPTALVGLVLSAPQGCLDPAGAPKARFWKSPRAYDLGASNLVEGPDIPGGPFHRTGSFIRSWGDFAAAELADDADAGGTASVAIFVTQLSTGKLWRVEPQAGSVFHSDAWTMTETRLYMGEKDPADDAWTVRRMRRIDLASLDQLGKPLN